MIDWVFIVLRVGFWLFLYILFLGIISFRVHYADGLSIQLPGWPTWLYLKYLKFRNMLPEEKTEEASVIKESFKKHKGKEKRGKTRTNAL